MGYFRIFYYITYILNFILRIIKRHGKAVLWFICIFIFLVLALYNPKSQAAYEGDFTYSDPNQVLFKTYDSFVLNFLKAYNGCKNTNPNNPLYTTINTLANNNYYGFYTWYGSSDLNNTNLSGLVMNNTFLYAQSSIYFCFYHKGTNNWTYSLSQYNYWSIDYTQVNKYTFTQNLRIFRINGTNLEEIDMSSRFPADLYVPSILWFYNNEDFYNYFINNYTIQEIETLYDMRNKLEQANQELQAQTDYLTEEPSYEDFTTSDLPTDSGVTDTTTSQVDNIFTTFYNVFTGDVENTKRNINITIPFTR